MRLSWIRTKRDFSLAPGAIGDGRLRNIILTVNLLWMSGVLVSQVGMDIKHIESRCHILRWKVTIMSERYFEIFSIESRTLEYIRDYLWYAEGTNSPEEFEELWIEIHPRRGFVPADRKYVHWFRPTFTFHALYKPYVEIPFRDDMIAQALNGRKFCTSRSKRYGEVGSVFSLPIKEGDTGRDD